MTSNLSCLCTAINLVYPSKRKHFTHSYTWQYIYSKFRQKLRWQNFHVVVITASWFYLLTLKIDTVCCSRTSVDFHQTTWHNIPNKSSLHSQGHGQLKSHTSSVWFFQTYRADSILKGQLLSWSINFLSWARQIQSTPSHPVFYFF
jgi:hypothetical protein